MLDYFGAVSGSLSSQLGQLARRVSSKISARDLEDRRKWLKLALCGTDVAALGFDWERFAR
jgi:hypothetical protein